MDYDELMKAFGSSLGLDEFEADEEGCYRLMLDRTLVAFFKEPQRDMLDIVAPLCEIPEAGGEQLYKILLTAMAPGNQSSAYTFFISKENNCVFLSRDELMEGLDAERLRQALEDFSNVLEQWRISISDFRNALPIIEETHEKQKLEERQFGMNTDGYLQV